jgi:hypothetical protein
VVLELLLELAPDAETLDSALERFCAIPPEIYRAIGADVLPIDDLVVVDGGRRS